MLNKIESLSSAEGKIGLFKLIKVQTYEYAGQLINDIGTDLGAWIKQQRKRQTSP